MPKGMSPLDQGAKFERAADLREFRCVSLSGPKILQPLSLIEF